MLGAILLHKVVVNLVVVYYPSEGVCFIYAGLT